MPDDDVALAYAQRAREYTELFGAMESTEAADRDFVLQWAGAVSGRILDVGCGPGHWTNFLRRNGCHVTGIDPVTAFVEQARARFPDDSFRVGVAERLDEDTAELGGVLAWYSLIHIDPDELDQALAEFARCIRPGGGLAIGFFAGATLRPFDHAVTTAWAWPPGQLSTVVERAGFDVTGVEERPLRPDRVHAALAARRRGRHRT